MSALGDKLRKARESVKEVDGHKFTIRRPTDLQLSAWAALGNEEFVKRCVLDYSGPAQSTVCGRDRLTGNYVFDSDAFVEWIGDEPALINAVVDHILQQTEKRAKTTQVQEKKS